MCKARKKPKKKILSQRNQKVFEIKKKKRERSRLYIQRAYFEDFIIFKVNIHKNVLCFPAVST